MKRYHPYPAIPGTQPSADRRFHAVIFDMDGVIVDTEPVYINWLRRFLEANHVWADEEEILRMAGISSQSYRKNLELWWRRAGKHNLSGPDIYELFNTFCEGHPFSAKEVQDPEADDVFRWLRSSGYQIALASSSSEDEIHKILEETGLAPWIDVIVSGAGLPESKPDPEIYYRTLEALNMDRRECLAVEDSTYGIQAARRAGILVAAKRDERFGFRQEEADFLIDRLGQLPELIQNTSGTFFMKNGLEK